MVYAHHGEWEHPDIPDVPKRTSTPSMDSLTRTSSGVGIMISGIIPIGA